VVVAARLYRPRICRIDSCKYAITKMSLSGQSQKAILTSETNTVGLGPVARAKLAKKRRPRYRRELDSQGRQNWRLLYYPTPDDHHGFKGNSHPGTPAIATTKE
jgi:hypothetical protein